MKLFSTLKHINFFSFLINFLNFNMFYSKNKYSTENVKINYAQKHP